MKIVPATFAAGVLLFCSTGLTSASQVHGSLDLGNTASSAASQIASLNDFRSFLANGCAASRGVSGGSRLAGNFTICGSEAIDASNHNLRRSMTMYGMPDDDLRLNTEADGFDFKHRRYGNRVNWIDRAMGRRTATGQGGSGAGDDDGRGGAQIASLVAGNDDSSPTAGADAGPSGPRQIGGSDGDVSGDSSSGSEVANLPSAGGATINGTVDLGDGTSGVDTSGDSAQQVDENAVAAGEVAVGLGGDSGAQALESGVTVDASVDGGYTTGSLDISGSLDESGSLEGADNSGAADGAGDVSSDLTDVAGEDGVQVSDELVGNGDESITTLEDGVPSTSESFFTEIDDQIAQADAADVAGVPILGSLPLLLTGLAAWGFIGRSRKKI